MNKQQRNYVKAQSLLKEWEELLASTETEYLRKNKIVNPDCSKPNGIMQIKDIGLLQKCTNELAKDIFHQKIWEGYLEAKELFQCAENQLLEYAISILPDGLGKAIDRAIEAKDDKAISRVIAILLDTSTVPGDGKAGGKERNHD